MLLFEKEWLFPAKPSPGNIFVRAFDSYNTWPFKYSSLLITPMIHSPVAILWQKHTTELYEHWILWPGETSAHWVATMAGFQCCALIPNLGHSGHRDSSAISLPGRGKGNHNALESRDPRHPSLPRALAIWAHLKCTTSLFGRGCSKKNAGTHEPYQWLSQF